MFVLNIKKKLFFLGILAVTFLLILEGINDYISSKNESLLAFVKKAQIQKEQVAQISSIFSQTRFWEQAFFRQPNVNSVQQVTGSLAQIQQMFTLLNIEQKADSSSVETTETEPSQQASTPVEPMSNSSESKGTEPASESLEAQEANETNVEEDGEEAGSWLFEEDEEPFDDGDDTILESADSVVTNVAIPEGITFEDYVGPLKDVPLQESVSHEIAKHVDYANNSLDDLFYSLVDLHHDYQTKFDTVVTNYEAMGFTLVEGYQGRFVNSAKEVETLLWEKFTKQAYEEDTKLLAYFLRIRLWEKEYLARTSSNTNRIRKGVQWIQNKLQQQNTEESIQINRLMDIYLSNLDRVITGMLDLRNAESDFNETVSHVKLITNALLQKVEDKNQSVVEDTNAEKSRLEMLKLVSLGFVIICLIGLGGLIARSIVQPLRKLQDATADLAEGEGDLTQTLEVKQKDEIGNIATFFNSFLEKLKQTMIHINTNGEQVEALAGQLYQSSNSLSDGVTSQAAAIEEISTSIKEISDQIQNNAQSTERVKKIAFQSKSYSEENKHHLENMVRAMEKIDESSNNISRIIQSIDDIAFQTNLLALNASVEAARAGVHGKGFAVVAEEVRNLSQKTTQAANEISDMIEDSIERVKIGNEITHQISGSFQSIMISSEELVGLIDNVAKASLSQANGIQGIDQGIEQINQVIQQTATSAHENSSNSQKLFQYSEQMQNLVRSFKLEDKNNKIGREASAGEV